MIKNSIALVIATIFMAACSVMMPYQNNFECEKGKNSGVCASVSEVYEMSFDIDKLKNKKLDQEEVCDSECQELKSENGNINKREENNYQKVKDIIQAVEIKKLQEGRPIIIIQNSSLNKQVRAEQNTQQTKVSKLNIAENIGSNISGCKSSGNNVVHILNQDIKVCVYRANIRKKPFCNAPIVRVAKRGEVLYAKYEKNGWIEIKGGYIHKSIIKKKANK